ncbi:hypothetical protein [Solimicrobium silvestre]|uniref:Uncharacterized protein n=1 Tax=Solimicrobium silvestre TaxID=2099400 RepID=A0A2S9H3S0_9BURK|nr:hypothetical protein [Solimicrobium silvestre]PRC94516.1 hypothetical protein S2091_0519 [Solimicrobium silvestre]
MRVKFLNLFPFVFILPVMFLCTSAHADVTYGFVRIACIPENGMLDVEYRGLHDSVVDAAITGQVDKSGMLSKNGFHDPHGLHFQCKLNGADYVISAEQDTISNRMCGGSSDIYLSLARNGVALIRNVVFGNSCYGLPSLTQFTLGEGSSVRDNREAKFCFSLGEETTADKCEWIFGTDEFEKRLPIDQAAITHKFAPKQ